MRKDFTLLDMIMVKQQPPKKKKKRENQFYLDEIMLLCLYALLHQAYSYLELANYLSI